MRLKLFTASPVMWDMLYKAMRRDNLPSVVPGSKLDKVLRLFFLLYVLCRARKATDAQITDAILQKVWRKKQ